MTKKENKDRNIYQRLHGVMQDVKYVQKEEKRVNNQYRFVSHDAVTKAVREGLVKHGVVAIPNYYDVTENGNKVRCKVSMAYINIDNPEDKLIIECAGFGFGIDNQDKAPGKAMSYAYKYALLKQFALETGDDPERDSIDYEPDHQEQIAAEYKAMKAKMKQALTEAETAEQLDGVYKRIQERELNEFDKQAMQKLYEKQLNIIQADDKKQETS